MPDLDWPTLAAPLDGRAPCGEDLRFDAEFQRLEQAAAGEPEVEIGRPGEPGYVYKEARGPNWRVVHEAALNLAQRTRDLRVAVWLLRAAARTQGLDAAVRALQLLQALLEQHWDDLHPRVDPTQPDTVTQRANAMAVLAHAHGGLADLRAAALTGQRGALTVRQIELAFGAAKPLAGEPLPTREGVLKGVAEAARVHPGLLPTMRAAHAAAVAIEACCAQRLPAAQRPDLKPFVTLLQGVGEAAGAPMEAAAAPVATSGAQAATPGEISSRDDAIRGLEAICAWIERHEPASPAPIFIRRSQQLLQKSFIEIIRDLLPEQVKQIEHYGGKTPS